MHEVLTAFTKLWKQIRDTGKYDPYVEKLALTLTTYEELDIRSQADLQYFQFALIFARFILYTRDSQNKDVKEALEKISKVI